MGIVRRQASKNTIIAFLGLFLGAFNVLYLYKVFFSLEEFGLVNLMLSIAIVFSQLSALGTVNTAIRFFPFLKTEDNKHHGFLTWIFLIAIIGFLVFVFIYLLFKPFIEDAFIENSPIFLNYYYLIIPLALFGLLFNIFEAISRAIHRTVYSAFLKDVLFRLLTTIGILFVAQKVLTFDEFIVYFITINGLIALLLCIQLILSKKVKFTLDINLIPFSKVKEFFNYGLYSLLAFSAYYITLNVDRIMIGSLVGADIVGVYSTYSNVILVTLTNISVVNGAIPGKFTLYNNYPNPFNPSTTIKFDVAKTTNVDLSLYDIRGNEVGNLVNKTLSPGTYEINWTAENLSSGIYFYKFETDEFISTKKMTLIK